MTGISRIASHRERHIEFPFDTWFSFQPCIVLKCSTSSTSSRLIASVFEDYNVEHFMFLLMRMFVSMALIVCPLLRLRISKRRGRCVCLEKPLLPFTQSVWSYACEVLSSPGGASAREHLVQMKRRGRCFLRRHLFPFAQSGCPTRCELLTSTLERL